MPLSAGIAVVVIAACYIIDNSLSVVEMARSTYIKKIDIKSKDLLNFKWFNRSFVL